MKRNRGSSGNRKPPEGFLIVDKPTGISSYDVIRAVKKCLSPRKIGHTGTLDPLASGVLPVAINGATKVIPFLDEGIKRYEGTLRLGMVTDSDDSTGRVLKETPLNRSVVTEGRIRGAFERFVGKIKQAPPMFSAVKCHGTPLYRLARRGIKVERREREVEVFSLRITGIEFPFVDFAVSCAKGTYVRVLSRQIGEALGVGAHLCRLRRTESGLFSLAQSVTLAEFDRLVEVGEIEGRIVSVREALRSMPEIEVGVELRRRIKHGHPVSSNDLRGLRVPSLKRKQRVKLLHEGDVLAIAEAQGARRHRNEQILEPLALCLLRVFA